MIFLGVDPDLTNLAFASWDSETGRIECEILKSDLIGEKGRDHLIRKLAQSDLSERGEWGLEYTAVAVEGQTYYPGKSKGNPNQLIWLGQLGGACAGLASVCSEKVYMPQPQVWKGTVPKHINQGRTFKTLGMTYTLAGTGDHKYCVPDVHKGFTKTQWKHLGDALGLALYAHKQWTKENDRAHSV